MGAVVGFPGHRWHRCESADCPWCAAGWFYCEVCEGAATTRSASSLTTDCCGLLLSAVTLEAVRMRALDFRRGRGWLECDALSAEMIEVASDLLDA